MKIAISTSVVQGGKSGVAQYVFSTIRELIESDTYTEIVLYVFEEDYSLFEFAAGQVKIIPVEEKWRPAVKNIWWHQFILPGLLRRDKIDILHIPSYRRMVWNAPCKMVTTIHDLAPFLVSGKYDIARTIYGKVVARLLAHRQDTIISVSECTAVDIDRFFKIPRSRVDVIHNGIDHKRFTPQATVPGTLQNRTWYSQAFGNGNTPYFLYVSRLEHPAKNHVRLIRAFENYKTITDSDMKLVLAGGDWHGAEQIHEAAENSPYKKDIILPGFVPDEDLPDLYRNAEAMIYPSLFEGFGLPPVEAMACGCPVVSADSGSLPEVVGDAALMIDPTDIHNITDAMIRITTNHSLRSNLVQKGLRRASQFDWAKSTGKVLNIYRSLTTESGSSVTTDSPAPIPVKF